ETSAARWLSIQPSIGATPAVLRVSVNPTGLEIGTYTGSVFVRQDVDLPATVGQTVRITLVVHPAAPASLRIQPSEVTLQYDLRTPQAPLPTAPVRVDSSNGTQLRFTVKPLVKTPRGFDWLSVDVNVAVSPATVKLTANPAGLGVGTYLAVVRFSLTSSGCDATTGPRLAQPEAPECDSVQSSVIFTISNPP